jgi:STE24 endopeptidase
MPRSILSRPTPFVHGRFWRGGICRQPAIGAESLPAAGTVPAPVRGWRKPPMRVAMPAVVDRFRHDKLSARFEEPPVQSGIIGATATGGLSEIRFAWAGSAAKPPAAGAEFVKSPPAISLKLCPLASLCRDFHMQLAILLVVVCAVSGMAADAPPAASFWQLPAGLSLLAAGPLAAMIARWTLEDALKQGRIDVRGAQKRWEAWYEAIAWLWAGGALAVLYLSGWPQVVRSLASMADWPLKDELLILAPLVASLVVVWVACHRVERLLPPAEGEVTVSLRQYVMLRVRHYLGLTLLPALVILGIQEAAATWHWTSGAGDQRAWWLFGALLAGAVLGFPLALKWLWQTQRVADSPLKERLLTSCRSLGCRVRNIVVWHTGGTLANAAVAGLLPAMRTIFLSDGLLARLSDDELDVVVRHEAAHLARRHLWQRMLLLALPVLVYFAVQTHWPAALAAISEHLNRAGVAPVWQMTLVVPLLAMAYALAAMGSLARMHEHDADLAACSSAGTPVVESNSVAHLHSALVKLVGDSSEYDRGRWLHPSVRQRVAFLKRAAHRPLIGVRFRARLFWVSCGLVLIGAAAAAAGLFPPQA